MTSGGFKYFAFASIISAENDSLTEDVKQDIMSRYSKQMSENKAWNDYDWEYILEPMEDKEKIQRFVKILKDDE